MNNSVLGKLRKTMRNCISVKLVKNRKKERKLEAELNFEHFTIFNDNPVEIQMKMTPLVFDKPVYCGMSILNISKTLMYDFHYNYIKLKYGDRAKLLFTEFDSVMYEIETEDFYKDTNDIGEEKFDTSNFPKDHPSGKWWE